MKSKLEYIINESVKRGWEELEMWGDIVDVSIDGFKQRNRIWVEYEEGDGECIQLSDIFFSHDWAKCVFGEEPVNGKECECCQEESIECSYAYHLSQLAQLETDEERVDYVYDYLKGNYDQTK